MRRPTRPFPSAVWALCLGALAGPAAYAEDPCAGDAKQYCPDVQPGSGRLVICLRQNQARLSAACRDRLAADALKARKVIERFGRSCQVDMAQLCAGIRPGGGRLLQCLGEHQGELSTSCQAEMRWYAEAREKFSAVKRACRADAERLCQGVPPQAGPLLECLQENEARLSGECNPADIRLAVEAAGVVDTVEEMAREDRVKEALEILQGIDSVAFSRSQILFQVDSFEGLGGKANASRFLFNPQLVFGDRHEFALQLKVPVLTLYPYASQVPTQSGLGAVVTAFAWAVSFRGQVGHYLSLALRWPTAAEPALGASWAVAPTYAVALGLARWLSLTTQLTWLRSFARGGYPSSNLLLLEPILVANLPGRSFLALYTRLGWNLDDDSFLPVMKGVAGLFLDRQKSVSISAWYQASLTDEAVSQTFKFELGASLAYFFDW